MNRRDLLAGCAATGAVALSGCLRDARSYSAEDDQDMVQVRGARPVPLSGDDRVDVALSNEATRRADYAVLVAGGLQRDAVPVGTGENRATLLADEVGSWDSARIILMTGGRLEDDEHVGGDVVARVALEVGA